MYAFFVSDVTAGTKTRRVFQDRTKSGGKKSYGPKWESSENVGTKCGFRLIQKSIQAMKTKVIK